MIVRYIKDRGYRGVYKDPHMTIGKTYDVFAINFLSDERPWEICVRRDSDAYPVLFDYSLFDIIDPRLPSYWGLSEYIYGGYQLSPVEFTGDFWELYHNADGDGSTDEVAAETFDFVARKIRDFHARLLPFDQIKAY